MGAAIPGIPVGSDPAIRPDLVLVAPPVPPAIDLDLDRGGRPLGPADAAGGSPAAAWIAPALPDGVVPITSARPERVPATPALIHRTGVHG